MSTGHWALPASPYPAARPKSRSDIRASPDFSTQAPICYIAAVSIAPELLPSAWHWTGHLAYGALLIGVVSRARWTLLLKSSELMHVYLGSCVALMVIWTIKAGVSPGLSFHYLGATLFTLMFGWELALIGFSLVVLATTLSSGTGWSNVSVNVLTLGAIPILFSHWLLRTAQRRLPNHVFIYIFVNAFFGAALAVLVCCLVIAGLLAAAGAYTMKYLLSEYLAFTPLMMFSEAWITGMLIAIFVGYRPNWVTTFEDSRYLHGK